MANLDAAADKAVHDAVDAFMEGRLVPDFAGETVFETKHSRYRLRDGVVYAAPSDGLIGAELVGWLMETPRRSLVESAWQPGSRAVLVDRARGRNIIVTSSTRLLHLEAGSQPPPPLEIPTARPPQQWRTLPPPAVAPRLAPPPILTTPVPPPYGSPRGAPVRMGDPPIAPAAFPPNPVPRTGVIPQAPGIPQQRRGAVHLPPRPIMGNTPPFALAPPSRAAAIPQAPPAPPSPAFYAPPPPVAQAPVSTGNPPQEEVPWDLTSSEIELDNDPDEAITDGNFRRAPPATESGAGAPIPLVKPRESR